MVGTADWLGQLNGLAWVDDLKTGWQTPEVVTPQMLFYALCWREQATHTEYRGEVVLSISHWPKMKG